MNDKNSEKLNVVHCELQELINECPAPYIHFYADLELMLKLVEEVRNDLLKEQQEI